MKKYYTLSNLNVETNTLNEIIAQAINGLKELP